MGFGRIKRRRRRRFKILKRGLVSPSTSSRYKIAPQPEQITPPMRPPIHPDVRDFQDKLRSEEYRRLLEMPAWKERSRQVRERDGHRCQVCGVIHGLECHHGYYGWDRDPWRYEDASLHTLCRQHHQRETDYADGEKKALVDALARKGALGLNYERLAKGIDKAKFQAPADEVFAAMAWSIYDKRSQRAMLKRYRKAKRK